MRRVMRAAKTPALVAAVAAAMWLVLAVLFSASVLRLDEVDPESAGCVAIFTGRHGRVLAAIDRFATDRVPHMLIAGATQGTNREERAQMVARAPAYFECCAEFEWDSRNTSENAAATAQWAQRTGCSRLTVVSDDYHLTRSIRAMRRRSGDIEVEGHAIPYVRAGEPGLRESARLIVSEFHKFLAAQITSR